jgi:hypothetical protein
MDAIPEFRRDILVSVRPIYASKILHGQKTVELRRKFPEVGATGALSHLFIEPGKRGGRMRSDQTCIEITCSPHLKEYGVATCISKHEFDAY